MTKKTTVDFSRFDLKRLAKVMTALRGKIDRTEYMEKGTILEKAVVAYSDQQLIRINEVGRDFRDEGGATYEQKIVQFKGDTVPNFVIKNWRGKSKWFTDDMLADFYIFFDVVQLQMCVVPNKFIEVKEGSDANVNASCTPLRKHFIKLPEVEQERSFFKQKEEWVESYLQSIPC